MPTSVPRRAVEPDPYAIPRDIGWPEDLAESRRRAYEQEWQTGSQRIGTTYRDLTRKLGEQAAQTGFYGAGAHASAAKRLALEEAAARIGLERDIAARQSAEGLGWAQGERQYQQQLGAMGAGYGYQSQLLGQQLAGTKDIETMKANLARELQSQGLSYQDAWKEAERQLQARGLDIEEYKTNIMKDLQNRGYDIEEAKYIAEIEAQKYLQSQTLGWEAAKFYGPEYVWPGGGGTPEGSFDYQPPPILGGGGGVGTTGSYGGLYGLQEREMALREAALEQAGQQFAQEHGYVTEGAEGPEYHAGTDWYQQMLQNNFTFSLERFKRDASLQDKAIQSLYDFGQLYISGGLEANYKFYAENLLNEIWGYLGMGTLPYGMFENLAEYPGSRLPEAPEPPTPPEYPSWIWDPRNWTWNPWG